MVTVWPHPKRDSLDTSVPVAVITWGDQSFGHGIARSLGRLGIPVYGVHSNPRSPEARSRYWRENFIWDIRKASPDESVDWLLQLARKLGMRPILIPTNDMCCLFVADNAAALREGFLFPNQPAGLARSLSSKKQMYFLCKKYSIPTAETVFPRSREDVIEFLRNATFPVMLKCIDYTALRSFDTRKKVILEDAEAVLKHYDKMEASEDIANFMLQEYIPGGSEMLWMFNGYFDAESRCLFDLTGKRFRQYPAYTGMTSLGICDANDAVARQTKDFMKAIGYQGILDIGHMYDTRTGQYKLLDANPRIGAAFRLFVDTCGLDVAQVLYRDLTGQPVLPGGPQVGRKWVVENYDVVSSLTLYRDGKLGVREWARSFRGVEEACWFTWDDPTPFFTMGWFSLKLVFERLFMKKVSRTFRMATLKKYQYPWEAPSLAKRISRKLMKLAECHARLKIGQNTMEVPMDLVWFFFDNGDYYEKNVTYWLEKILLGTKNKVFYDIGANYGYYCLKFAGNASHIYAFEPVSRTHDILAKNIRRNNLTNVTAYKLGLSDKKSSREIHLYGNSGKNSLFLRSGKLNPHEMLIGQEVIDLVTLDDFIRDERLTPPDLIKVDIEGSELYALRGARKTITKYQPILLIEYMEATFKDAGYSRSDLLSELRAENYVIYGIPEDITDLNVYPVAKFDDIEVTNIIALPKGLEYLIDDTLHDTEPRIGKVVVNEESSGEADQTGE